MSNQKFKNKKKSRKTKTTQVWKQMSQIKKPLLNQVKFFCFFRILIFIFLIKYFDFLIWFNLRNNLSFDNSVRGKFYYLFGKRALIKKLKNETSIDWAKLLLLLHLLFLLKIIAQLLLDRFSFKEIGQLHLAKKPDCFSNEKSKVVAYERAIIGPKAILDFSHQLFIISISLLSVIIDIMLSVFSIYFSIKTRRYLPKNICSIVFYFIFINLVWIIKFHLLFLLTQKEKAKQKNNIKRYEIKNHNFQLWFFSLSLNKLPYLVISGTILFFLSFYYNFWLVEDEKINWDVYFIAFNLKNLLFKINELVNLLTDILILKVYFKKHELSRFSSGRTPALLS